MKLSEIIIKYHHMSNPTGFNEVHQMVFDEFTASYHVKAGVWINIHEEGLVTKDSCWFLKDFFPISLDHHMFGINKPHFPSIEVYAKYTPVIEHQIKKVMLNEKLSVELEEREEIKTRRKI